MKYSNKYKSYIVYIFLFSLFGFIGVFLSDANVGIRPDALSNTIFTLLPKITDVSNSNWSIANYMQLIIAYIFFIVCIFVGILITCLVEPKFKDKWKSYAIGVGSTVFLLVLCTILAVNIFASKQFNSMLFVFLFVAAMSGVFYCILVVIVMALTDVVISTALTTLKAKGRKAKDRLSDDLTSASTTSQDAALTSFEDGEEPLKVEICDNLKSSKELFPGLYGIDVRFKKKVQVQQNTGTYSLSEIAERFHAFLVANEMYYTLETIQTFIAGMSVSRLIILEGISGTGKSSLPRLFSEFLNVKAFFTPVQSTWRNKSDVIGYYNDLSNQYKETEFLKRLYTASYLKDELNMMVLDEMNLSRIEYYFADFLSVLEYPEEDWKIPLMQIPADVEAPKCLSGNQVVIPQNTWFIGTANNDDSTFTITDKVYDRAIVLSFEERIEPIVSNKSGDTIRLSSEQLNKMFNDAKANTNYQLTKDELDKFIELCKFTYEIFDLQFGNRILNQIINIAPVYVALGGNKVDILDFMYSNKILRKISGKYAEYINLGLTKLSAYLTKQYGKGKFKKTEALIKQMQKKFN